MKTNFYWILLFFLLGSKMSFGQNPLWLLDNRFINIAGIQNLPKPTTYYGQIGSVNTGTATNPYPYDGYDGQKPKFAGNIQPKPDGTIDFFIMDGVIYDGQGNFIYELVGNISNGYTYTAGGTSEVIIVPFPGQCNKYFIFSTVVYQDEKRPYVFILDMNLNNQNTPNPLTTTFRGALVDANGNIQSGTSAGRSIQSLCASNTNLLGYNLTVDPTNSNNTVLSSRFGNVHMAAGPLQSNNTRLFFITNFSGLYVFRINSNATFTYLNRIQFPFLTIEQLESRNELEVVQLSNGNYRIATAYNALGQNIFQMNLSQLLMTIDLNSNGIEVGSSLKTFPLYQELVNGNSTKPTYKGIEFSQNGRYLFVTNSTTQDGVTLKYFDFDNSSMFNLTPISTALNCNQSMLERNSNNEIVIAHSNGLSKISANGLPPFTVFTMLTTPYSPNSEWFPSSTHLNLCVLPDQIDGADYTQSYFQEPACCVLNSTYSKIAFTATTSATWTPASNPLQMGASVVTIRDELRIPPGITITLSGLTIQFAPNAKVIIENSPDNRRGGRLVLSNNSILTRNPNCGTKYWMGVEVWGNSNLNQETTGTTKQGSILVQGNSTIEYAMIGILSSRRTSSFTFNDAFNGGIVQVNQGNLLNNQRGVWMRKYYSPNGLNNLSFFTRANFDWNNDFNSTNLSVQELLRMEEVTGIIIRGSLFRNNISVPSNSNFKKGRGILSMTSHFIVRDFCTMLFPNIPCPSPTKSEFINLDNAIRATSSNYNKTFWVYNSYFQDNKFGIYGLGANDIKITLNDFRIREDNLGQSVGVALYSCSGYTIEGNNFEEWDNPSVTNGTSQSHGIVINNSGTSDNEVYRNTFSKLKVGGLSEGTNGETFISGSTYFDTKGLRWTCNTFNDPIYQTDLGINGIIAYQQGYPITTSVQQARMNAARNKFSMSGESVSLYPNHDIWSTPISQQINYTHLADFTHVPDNYTTANVYTSLALASGVPVFSSSDMCPSQIVHDITFSNLKMTQLKQEISLSKEKLSNGSDENLVHLIENQTDESQITDVLLSRSPYLSDAVLLSLIASPYSENSKHQLLLANTPLSQQVKENLPNANLGSLHLEELNNLSIGETPIQKLRSEINFMEFEWNKLYHRNLQEYLFNEDAVDFSDLKDYLSSVDDESAVKMKYDILLSEKQFSEVNEIKQNNNFTDHREFIKLQEIKEELVKSTNDEELLSEDDELRTKLDQIHQSETNNELASKSQAILEKVVGLFDIPDFNPLFAPLYRVNPTNQSNTTLISNESAFAVFPNPANEAITLVFENWKSLNIEFQVFDVRGAKVSCPQISSSTHSATFDTSNLKEGVYVLKVMDNQLCVQVLKFVVRH